MEYMETMQYWDLFSIISLKIKESMEKYGIPMFPWNSIETIELLGKVWNSIVSKLFLHICKVQKN